MIIISQGEEIVNRREEKMLETLDWFEADEISKETAYIMYEILKKQQVTIAQFHTINKVLTELVYNGTICCEKKDLITDTDCH